MEIKFKTAIKQVMHFPDIVLLVFKYDINTQLSAPTLHTCIAFTRVNSRFPTAMNANKDHMNTTPDRMRYCGFITPEDCHVPTYSNYIPQITDLYTDNLSLWIFFTNVRGEQTLRCMISPKLAPRNLN